MLLENLDAKGFDLTPEEMKKISALDQNLRFNDPLIVSFSVRMMILANFHKYFGCLPIFN
jgi:D-xylose reductase